MLQEQLQVQLAGCLAIAEGHGPIAVQGDYGWSLAYGRTRQCRAVVDAVIHHLADMPADVVVAVDDLRGSTQPAILKGDAD